MNGTLMIIAVVLALAATIASYILIIPEKKRAGLHPFLQKLHDIFNFKNLMLESILKALYVFTSLLCVFAGFFMLFGYEGYWGHVNTFPQGLVMMLLGPILVRLVFELSMMMVLMVKNVIQINKKMGGEAQEEAVVPPAAPQASPYKFCGQCGTRYEITADSCPCCGSRL